MTFWAIAASISVYVVVSLLGPRKVCDMDRLLHRGKYAVAGESSVSYKDARTWMEKLGFSREFTGGDRIITYITLGWPLIWTVIFVIVTVYNLMVDVPDESWATYWHGWTWFLLACAVMVTLWFTIGGVRDLRDLYHRLRLRRDQQTDDGRVANTSNRGQ
jgi:SSS family solute:Na+ symporter